MRPLRERSAEVTDAAPAQLLHDGRPESLLRTLIAYTDIDMLWGDEDLTEALEELAQEAEAMDKRFQENEKVNGEMRAFMAGLLAHTGDELDDDFHDLYDDEDEYDEDEDPDFATLDDDGNEEESDDDIPDSSSDDDFLRFLRDLARKK